MSTQSFAAPAPVTRRVRAYFAPVCRTTGEPVLFDAGAQCGFDVDAPPAPWRSAGSIQSFTRKATSKSCTVVAGAPGAALEQLREMVGAEVSMQFLSWTKLTMALASASQHVNLLSPGAEAIALQDGCTAEALCVGAQDASQFAAGQMVAVDVDYAGETGYVGSPVCGGYLRRALNDADYLRRITFQVAVVSKVDGATLELAQPLPWGAPAPGAKVQAIAGFADREGGSFRPEWSGLFVMEGAQGERIFFHYPRLQPLAPAEESAQALDATGKGRLERIVLNARFVALPVMDSLDGERVVCYRSFLPMPDSQI